MQKPDHEQWNYWGVITSFDHQDQRHLLIAAFKELGLGRYVSWDLLDPVIRVGEVSHLKK